MWLELRFVLELNTRPGLLEAVVVAELALLRPVARRRQRVFRTWRKIPVRQPTDFHNFYKSQPSIPPDVIRRYGVSLWQHPDRNSAFWASTSNGE